MSRHLYNEHEALIKTYAAAGRKRRLQGTRQKHVRVAVACSAAIAAVVAGYGAIDPELDFTAPEFTMPTVSIPEITLPSVSLPEFALPELSLPEFSLPELPARENAPEPATASQVAELRNAQELNMALQAELSSVAQNRAELTRQRELLAEQRAELEAETTRLEARRMDLGAAHAELAADDTRLLEREARIARLEDELNTRRAALERESPQLQANIETLAQQRQELDEQRQRFRAQRNLLEHEIALLQEQRAALETQQAELADQWESLQVLIQQVSDARDFLRQQQSPVETDDDLLALPDADSLMAASEPVIDESELGEIRGGIDTGELLDITIGLTRTVDVNGVEQYSSALQLGELTPATAEQIGSLTPVVIQNGPGNTVEDAALGAVNGSFPVIIQNSLDNQHIVNMNVLDVTVGNIGNQVSGAAASSAVSESMSLQN